MKSNYNNLNEYQQDVLGILQNICYILDIHMNKDIKGILGDIWTKLETLNDRTKKHTEQIRELDKRLKEVEK